MSILDTVIDDFGDKLIKAAREDEHDSMEETVNQLVELMAIPEDGSSEEAGPFYKAIEEITKNQETLGKTLEQIIERIEKLENRGAVSKSADGQDGQKDEDLSKSESDTSWDSSIKALINNPGRSK